MREVVRDLKGENNFAGFSGSVFIICPQKCSPQKFNPGVWQYGVHLRYGLLSYGTHEHDTRLPQRTQVSGSGMELGAVRNDQPDPGLLGR